MSNTATILAHVGIAQRVLEYFDSPLLLDAAGDIADRATAQSVLKIALGACARALADLQVLP